MSKMTTTAKPDSAAKAKLRPADAAAPSDDGGMDWAAFDALTDEDVMARASCDPDNKPWTAEELAGAKTLPRIKAVRRAMKLSVEEFAELFGVPAEMIPEWESGRVEPTPAEHAYFKVIAVDAEFVEKALAFRPARPDQDASLEDEPEKKAS